LVGAVAGRPVTLEADETEVDDPVDVVEGAVVVVRPVVELVVAVEVVS
jgi:hypothetical protein